jgi:hypothetical protein
MLPATRQLADASLKIPGFKAVFAPEVVNAKSVDDKADWLKKAAWTFMQMARALSVPEADAQTISAAFIQMNFKSLEDTFKAGGAPNMIPFMRFVGENSTFESAPTR